jgi:hypothetical protein
MAKVKTEAEKILQNKVYVDLGKVPIRYGNGKTGTEHRYLIMSELQARIAGATYGKVTPTPITVYPRKGKPFTREVVLQVTRATAHLHYATGTKTVFIAGKSTKVPSFAKVPINVPQGMSLKQVLQIVRTKWKKKPSIIEMSSGLKTRFVSSK